MNIDNKQRTQLIVALGAVVALVIGFSAFGKSDSSADKTALQSKAGGPPGQMRQGGPPGQGGPRGSQMPQQVAGDAAVKAKAAALEAVDGTVRGVMENPRGEGYVVFVETDDGGVMVELDDEFKVTEKREMRGGPGRGGPGQGGQAGPPGMDDDRPDSHSDDGNVQ